VASLSKDMLNHSNTLLLSLMGKHLASHGISNSEYSINIGLPVVVDWHLASLVSGHSGLIQLKSLSEGVTANGDQAHITVNL
jgi:hypothetical protein